MEVDRKIKVPLYMQIYERLLDRIRDGTYHGGALLPPERELSGAFGVDRLTVRRALAIMADEGLVEKKAGLGTWIKKSPPDRPAGAGTRSIAFFLPNSGSRIDRITEPCISRLFYGVERNMSRRGFQLIYSTLGEGEDLTRLLKDSDCAGIIFVSQIKRTFLQEARRMQIPAVALNACDGYFPSILPDREGGTFDAVSHLAGLGHRKIAFISGISTYGSSQSNFAGYKRALVETDLDWKGQPVRHGDWTFDGGYRAMKSILEEENFLPTAVFACNDMSALGAVEAIKEAELSVPQDISVVGFDDVELCTHSSPKLTTVHVDTDLMADAACQKLMFTIESGQIHSVRIMVPTRLVIRDSTARARD